MVVQIGGAGGRGVVGDVIRRGVDTEGDTAPPALAVGAAFGPDQAQDNVRLFSRQSYRADTAMHLDPDI